jgi:hypothetical protein
MEVRAVTSQDLERLRQWADDPRLPISHRFFVWLWEGNENEDGQPRHPSLEDDFEFWRFEAINHLFREGFSVHEAKEQVQRSISMLKRPAYHEDRVIELQQRIREIVEAIEEAGIATMETLDDAEFIMRDVARELAFVHFRSYLRSLPRKSEPSRS